MTKQLPRRSVLFKKQVAEAREQLAKTLFDVETVFTAMAEATTKGHAYLVVAPPEPVDLTHTSAAKALLDALEREGFRWVWDRHDNPMHREFPAYFDLLIQWDAESVKE